MLCEVCGVELPKRQGRGRPRQYHQQCKMFADGLALLRAGVERLPSLSPAAAARLAGELLLVRNGVRRHIDKAGRRAYGARLAAARRKAGLTQKAVAVEVGVLRAEISRYEQGRAEPSLATRRLLRLLLGVFSPSKNDDGEGEG